MKWTDWDTITVQGRDFAVRVEPDDDGMREYPCASRMRMLAHIERCERARGLVVCASVSIPPEGDVWGESVTADACYSGHELLAIRIPGSDVWQLPTAYQAQAWADGRITIGAQL